MDLDGPRTATLGDGEFDLACERQGRVDIRERGRLDDLDAGAEHVELPVGVRYRSVGKDRDERSQFNSLPFADLTRGPITISRLRSVGCRQPTRISGLEQLCWAGHELAVPRS